MAGAERFSRTARQADGYRFGVLVPILVAVVGLALLVAGQLVPNRHGMEHSLTDRSTRALAAAGLSTVEVSFTGRDGTLHAHTRADADRALAIVRALNGVRVASAVVDPAPQPQPGTPPMVTIQLTSGGWTLSGTVPTADARTALEHAATTMTAATASPVADQLTVDATVTDEGLAGLAEVVTAFGTQATDALVELRSGTLTIGGTVAEQATKDAVLAAAAKAVGAGHVVDHLNVVPVQKQLVEIPPVTFVTGSATLTPQGQQALVRAADVLKANPQVRVSIEGHTDSTGSAAANLALSKARAQTVLDTLAALGVARDRMSATGFGETRPKVPDNSPANKAINRRVEFIVQQ